MCSGEGATEARLLLEGEALGAVMVASFVGLVLLIMFWGYLIYYRGWCEWC